MILMMMSKSENIFLVKKTFLYVVKMLKYSPIWSPCEVQEPNFNLQLWESWGHCLRSTWDHHLVDDDDDGDDDDDDEDDEDGEDGEDGEDACLLGRTMKIMGENKDGIKGGTQCSGNWCLS